VRQLQDACRQLDARDALLGPLRTECSTGAVVAVATAGIVGCQCARTYGAVAKAIMRFVAAGHEADRAVRQARLAPACTRALVIAPTAYAYYEQLALAIGMKQRALEAGSSEWPAELARSKAAELARLLPTYRRQLQELRAGCR
jgi:hypothetical protein